MVDELGGFAHELPPQEELARLAHPFYNSRARGGEGHLEIGKNIYYTVNRLAHMVLSVKPFGCMPSSGVSDGIQTVITELHPDAIYCPVETSGDGAVNFYSRVQMYMFKARERARLEFQDALAHHGITEAQAREFIENNPRYGHTFHKAPHVVAGTGADLIHQIGPLVGKGRIGRAKVHATRAATRTMSFFKSDLPAAKETYDKMAPYLPSLARLLYVEGKEKLPAPKDAWRALVRRVVPKADDVEVPTSHEYVAAPEPRQDHDAETVQLQVVG